MNFLDLDYRVFRLLNGLAGESVFADAVFILLSEYVVFLMIAGLALFVLLNPSRRSFRVRTAFEALAAAVVARLLFASILRMIFSRSRPFLIAHVTQLVPHNPSESSFPSGHAAVMFAAAMALFFKNKAWGGVYFIFAVLSGISRVIVGVHFPSDILAGAFLGVAAAWLVVKIRF